MPATAAVAFDAYGTLFDLGGLRSSTRAAAGTRGNDLFDAFAVRLVPLSWYATAADAYRPFPELALLALESAARELGIDLDRGRAEEVTAGLTSLPPYPDAAEALSTLSGRRRLAVLSNGTRAGVRQLVEAAGIAGHFDRLLVADEVRRFKPAAAVYRLAAREFSTEPRSVVLVSGNEWDVAGAGLAGLRTVWIARGRRPTGFLGVEPEIVCAQLADVPAALAEVDGSASPRGSGPRPGPHPP